jgi:hypothetical protein
MTPEERTVAIDKLGKIHTKIKALEDEYNELRDQLNHTAGTFLGRRYKIVVTFIQGMYFRKEIAESFLTPAQYQACFEPGKAHHRLVPTILPRYRGVR